MKKKRCKRMQISNLKFQVSNSRREGFTLLELIIAITILSLITMIIGSAFRLGIQAWGKGEHETGETQRLRVLSSLLSQQLKSSYPYEMPVEDDIENAVMFKGEKDSIMFVTTVTDSSYGGFKWVRYEFKDGTLLYKEGLLPDKKIKDKIKEDAEIIDSNIEEFQLSYRQSNDGEWKESWDLGNGIPAAVKVKVSYFQPFVVNIPMFKDNSEVLGVENNETPGQT